MLKNESMAEKKIVRRAKRGEGLSNKKKVGKGWDSALKLARTGFEPRNKVEAKAHQMKFKKKVKE